MFINLFVKLSKAKKGDKIKSAIAKSLAINTEERVGFIESLCKC